MPKRLTTEQFIAKAKLVHGDKYDYRETMYLKQTVKVKIICKKHGEFYQFSSNHLKGCGCNDCGLKITKKKRRKLPEDFKKEANVVHSNKYDYSLTVYKNGHTKIKIICPEHGTFEQQPNNHLMGKGCRKCQYKKLSDTFSLSNKQVIKRLKKLNGDKYDYSKVNYVNWYTPISIKCLIHGLFEQLPTVAFRGGQCPKCLHLRSIMGFGRSEFIKKYKDSLTTFYVINVYNETESFIKVGITGKSIKHRFSNSHMPYKYKVLYTYISTPKNVWNKENKLKKLFKPYKYIPQLAFAGYTECFTKDALSLIPRI